MYAAGGNAATVAALVVAGRAYRAFVAHDLDAENLALLRSGQLSRGIVVEVIVCGLL